MPELFVLDLTMCDVIDEGGSILIAIEADFPENNGKNSELPGLLVFFGFCSVASLILGVLCLGDSTWSRFGNYHGLG